MLLIYEYDTTVLNDSKAVFFMFISKYNDHQGKATFMNAAVCNIWSHITIRSQFDSNDPTFIHIVLIPHFQTYGFHFLFHTYIKVLHRQYRSLYKHMDIYPNNSHAVGHRLN
jgi:hypothetical protein